MIFSFCRAWRRESALAGLSSPRTTAKRVEEQRPLCLALIPRDLPTPCLITRTRAPLSPSGCRSLIPLCLASFSALSVF